MVMPNTASTAMATIWTTAKLTEVNRRHRRIPARAARLGPVRPSGRPAARAGRSIVRPAKDRSRSHSGRHGRWSVLRGGACRGQRTVEVGDEVGNVLDRKSTRLNSSHSQISYAVFCLKKKNITRTQYRYQDPTSNRPK